MSGVTGLRIRLFRSGSDWCVDLQHHKGFITAAYVGHLPTAKAIRHRVFENIRFHRSLMSGVGQIVGDEP
jgi:hypothetical protein